MCFEIRKVGELRKAPWRRSLDLGNKCREGLGGWHLGQSRDSQSLVERPPGSYLPLWNILKSHLRPGNFCLGVTLLYLRPQRQAYSLLQPRSCVAMGKSLNSTGPQLISLMGVVITMAGIH